MAFCVPKSTSRAVAAARPEARPSARTKKLTEPVIGTRILTVEGMTCENCRARVENAINHYNGVVCKVDLKKKTATVSFSQPIEDLLLKQTVEKLGYTITDIR